MKFCKVADIVDWQGENFQTAGSLLQLEKYKNRKAWEFIQVYSGLQTSGMLHPEARALGLGVGHECLIYAFSNVCKEVIATDLYDSSDWSTASMSIQAVYHCNPFPYNADRLIVQHMDMTQIEFPDASFDFIWSCCSIEHVNNFRDLYKVYQEIHRVLKPGGIAALTTEFNFTDDKPSYEPNMLFTDRLWMECWLTGENPLIQGFKLLDTPDYSITPQPENAPQPRTSSDYIQVYCNDVVVTSIAFFLQKQGEFSPQPYSEDWLPPFWHGYLAACDRYREQDFSASEQILQQMLQSDLKESRLKLKATRRLADALFAQGKVAALKVLCQQAFPDWQQGDDSDHLFPLAFYCQSVGLFQEAIDLCEKIFPLPSTILEITVRTLLLQAECFGQLNQYESALEVLTAAVEHLSIDYSFSPVIQRHIVEFRRGVCQEKLGKIAAAIADYQSALQSAPSSDLAFQIRCYKRLSTCLKQRSQRLNKQNQRLKQKTKQLQENLTETETDIAQIRSRNLYKLGSAWAKVKRLFK